MANDPTEPLAAAVWARLASPVITYTEGGTALEAPAHQNAPDGFLPAIVVVDSVDIGPAQTKGGNDRLASVNIVTVYRGRSKNSAQRIMAAVFNRLEHYTLTVPGFTVGACRVLNSGVGEEATEANLVHVGRQTIEVIIL